MPTIPPVTIDYYDPVELVLNFARTVANDCALSLAGNLLSDSQPGTLPTLNLAWRKLQDRLTNNAVERFPTEIVIPSVPPINPAVQSDPAIQVFINSSGYWDGAQLWPNLTLPPNFQIPLKMFERPSGQSAEFIPMWPASNGIPSTPKSTYSRVWEWRNDSLFMPGALQVNDLKVRFQMYLDDKTDPSEKVPIIRCAVALAYLVVEIFAEGRGSTITPVFQAEKEDAIKQIINLTTRKKQHENFRRQPYSRRNRLRGW